MAHFIFLTPSLFMNPPSLFTALFCIFRPTWEFSIYIFSKIGDLLQNPILLLFIHRCEAACVAAVH